MSVFSIAGGNPALPTYPLQRSVRLRASASAYFNRTTTTPTSGSIFTHSFWVKRGILGSQSTLISGARPTNFDRIYFSATDTLVYQWNDGASNLLFLETTQVFRDPSAWYHIIVATDTPQATNTNRVKIYVNGVQVTAFSTATYPTQNSTSYLNINAGTLNLGRTSTAVSYLDGYLEEINFIDGQALTPSSFGTFNSYGVWSPAKYTGSYGNNGFYLSFQDNSALTTTANVGIGKDSSGNGNYWTSNNISITAGTTYDSMLDVPTLTSNTNANYCTINPNDTNGSAVSVTNGNLTFNNSSTTGIRRGTLGTNSGKIYFEIVQQSSVGLTTPFNYGIASLNGAPTHNALVQAALAYTDGSSKAFWRETTAGIVQTVTPSSFTVSVGDIIQVAYDATTGNMWFGKNNVWYDSSGGTTGNPSTGANPVFTFPDTTQPMAPIFEHAGGVYTASLNCGQQPFTYTPPTGFNRLNTYNLPDSIVPVGAQYMAATLFTSNGTTQNITNTVNGFSLQPDFLWIKPRSIVAGNYVTDSVRGASKYLVTNLTNAEVTDAQWITSLNSSGFSIGTNNLANGTTNVAWQWRASNASAVTNTAGTITSSVSANQTAGFSIVTYTGNGSAGATVGHGLGVAPSWIILKNTSSTQAWTVGTAQPAGWDRYMTLNSTNAATLDGTVWNTTNPTSSVFTLGTSLRVNGNGGTYVAYCFAAVRGYSAFGSYTGNGSTDGPFVYLGFKPRWLMIKRSDSNNVGTAYWFIYDTSRNTANVTTNWLAADLSSAETSTSTLDLVANGFKWRDSGGSVNASGGTYIYAAFAENPFKNSLAR
jgi:hypothetical protein